MRERLSTAIVGATTGAVAGLTIGRRATARGTPSNLAVADRVHTTVAPVARRGEVDEPHAIIDDGIVTLHGRVRRSGQRRDLEDAVLALDGVEGIESYLRVDRPGHSALLGGDGQRAPSWGRERLEEAAATAGAAEPTGAAAAVLGWLVACLPPGSRRSVAASLPADVVPLLHPPRRRGERHRVRTEAQLFARVSAAHPRVTARVREVTTGVLAAFAEVLRDHAPDVGELLPPELDHLWPGVRRSAVATAGTGAP